MACYDRANTISLNDSLGQMALGDVLTRAINHYSTAAGKAEKKGRGEQMTPSQEGVLGVATQSPARSVLCSPHG